MLLLLVLSVKPSGLFGKADDQEGLSMRGPPVAAVHRDLRARGVPLRDRQPLLPAPAETIAIYAILLLGLDIVFGYTGEVSLGHAALFGIGSYTAGVLSMKFGIGLWWSLLAVRVRRRGAFGALLALPALRVTGPYLAMVTLAFGTIIQILINEMDFLTNGPLGIIADASRCSTGATFELLPFLDMPLNRCARRILLAVAGRCWCSSIVVINRMLALAPRPRLRGAARQPDRLGLHGRRASTATRSTPSSPAPAFAGLAGVLFTYSEQYIAPNNYNFELSGRCSCSPSSWAGASRGSARSRRGDHRAAAEPARRHRPVPRRRAGASRSIAVGRGASCIAWRQPTARRARRRFRCSLCVAFWPCSRCCCRTITDYGA